MLQFATVDLLRLALLCRTGLWRTLMICGTEAEVYTHSLHSSHEGRHLFCFRQIWMQTDNWGSWAVKTWLQANLHLTRCPDNPWEYLSVENQIESVSHVGKENLMWGFVSQVNACSELDIPLDAVLPEIFHWLCQGQRFCSSHFGLCVPTYPCIRCSFWMLLWLALNHWCATNSPLLTNILL